MCSQSRHRSGSIWMVFSSHPFPSFRLRADSLSVLSRRQPQRRNQSDRLAQKTRREITDVATVSKRVSESMVAFEWTLMQWWSGVSLVLG